METLGLSALQGALSMPIAIVTGSGGLIGSESVRASSRPATT